MALIKNTLVLFIVSFFVTSQSSNAQSLAASGKPGVFTNIDLRQALSLASAQNKKLLLFFSAGWSTPCKAMERSVFSHDMVKNALSEYIAIKIDVDTPAGQQLEDQFKVGAYPTVMIVNSASNVMKRNDGALRKKNFLKFLSAPVRTTSTTADQK